jgi:ADP-heptose:LPS heptosyltransferase
LIADWIIKNIPNFKKKEGVGIILVNRLGDALVSIPVINFLASKYNQNIEIIGDKTWEVLKDNIYKNHSTKFIDERKYRENLIYRIQVNLFVRSKNWETCICFMHHRIEMRDEYLVSVSDAKNKIISNLPSFFIDNRWYPWVFEVSHNLMNKLVPTTNEKKLFDIDKRRYWKVPHVTERQRTFIENLFGEESANSLIRPILKINHQPIDRLKSKQYIVINFGASGEDRVWSIRNWVRLAKKFIQKNFLVVFSGGPNEMEYENLIEEIISEEIGETDKIILLINKVNFDKLIGVFQHSKLFLGPDTGTSHLAVLLGVPSVILLVIDESSIHFDRFGDFFPYPKGYLIDDCEYVYFNTCEFKTELQLNEIEQSNIYKKAMELLNKNES